MEAAKALGWETIDAACAEIVKRKAKEQAAKANRVKKSKAKADLAEEKALP